MEDSLYSMLMAQARAERSSTLAIPDQSMISSFRQVVMWLLQLQQIVLLEYGRILCESSFEPLGYQWPNSSQQSRLLT